MSIEVKVTVTYTKVRNGTVLNEKTGIWRYLTHRPWYDLLWLELEDGTLWTVQWPLISEILVSGMPPELMLTYQEMLESAISDKKGTKDVNEATIAEGSEGYG